MKPSLLLTLSLQVLRTCAFGATGGKPGDLIWEYHIDKRQSEQDIVTWDEHSLFVHGERVMIFSGEVHPFRLPVPSLWSDVFEKIKALGFNCVSFYVDWALLEGAPGNYSAEGVFDLKPFFDAAQDAGLWLLARPGPYINAEVSGGGYPGWLQRVRGALRTPAPDYLAATDNYMANICRTIAEAQITNGGPVILFQPENEYTSADQFSPFPDGGYMEYVMQQARDAGIVVPFISNDASASGHNAPGTGIGEVDIYGHDGYPLGFDCAHPTVWPNGNLPTAYRANHLAQSPSTPFSLVEFQGGSFDPWGGWGFEQCSQLVNHEFERVFYKNNYAVGVTIYNLYMIFGGTNWGNLGHPGGYTSYDYGSVLKEDRTVTREKYSELKLQATFIQSSPGYLTVTPGTNTTGVYSENADILITPLFGNTTDDGSFFIVRHSNYSSLASTQYRVTLPTSQGNLTIPQGNITLSLNGRDSKVMVTDYDVQGTKLLYSSADIFTHQATENGTVLILYAGEGEYNEFGIQGSKSDVSEIESGSTSLVAANTSDYVAVGWTASSQRSILQIGDLYVYLLDRNSAYNYWVTGVANTTNKLIINGPYLVRSASIADNELSIRADLNETSTIVEVLGSASSITRLLINDQGFPFERTGLSIIANISLTKPTLSIPTLTDLPWKSIDSLPELQSTYDDSAWPVADLPSTNNTFQPLRAPVSTYASDYGFHAGSLIYRGHFNATGYETTFALLVQGGSGFGATIWLDGAFLSTYTGNGTASYAEFNIEIPSSSSLEPGTEHIFTIVVDHMGQDENGVWSDDMKAPRGVLGWRLATSIATSTPVAWRLTGNLRGEAYVDRARGPLNEGGLFAERQGYHLPSPPTDDDDDSWTSSTPFEEGLSAPGVTFYSTSFTLDIPSAEWDVPLAFAFTNDTTAASSGGGAYRAQLYINGWQFGKYVSDIGPQTVFPVPEGILDYGGAGGENWLGLTVWALEEGGARVPGLEMVAGEPVWTGRKGARVVESPRWVERAGAY
ncbi:glycoside hydrolase family 35 protein [Xylariomycetidae sp. FL2044]|nr:glycoside hydrolase family 35 protein [Xylariomycetidae sp. FL2044]